MAPAPMQDHWSDPLSQSALMAVVGIDGHFENMSGALRAVLRNTPELASKLDDLTVGALGFSDWEAVVKDIDASGDAQRIVCLSRSLGDPRRYRITLTRLQSKAPSVDRFLLIATDVTALVEAHWSLEQQAYHDPLTGLFNRRYLEEAYDLWVRGNAALAVVLLDLAKFKQINDTLGHEAGDAALRHVAQALTETVPIGSLIVRLAGDEFVVLLDELECAADHIEDRVQEMLHAISEPVDYREYTLRVAANAGVSQFPEHGTTLPDLLRRADEAMYASKHAKSTKLRQPSKPDMLDQTEMDLHRALSCSPRDSTLRPWYQPIVDLATGTIVGAEALCRWHHPDRGILQPVGFIPLAEQRGLIAQVDRRILELALRDLAAWRDQGHEELEMSCNVSAKTLVDRNFTYFVEEAIATSGTSPAQLCVELTETVMLEDTERARDILCELHMLGAKVALDDFGTGYTSIALLNCLPISRIKIDRSFIKNITTNRRDQQIVKGMVEISKALEAELLGEGVEVRAQAETLRYMGFTHAQGYLYAKPLPAAAFSALLRVHKKKTAIA